MGTPSPIEGAVGRRSLELWALRLADAVWYAVVLTGIVAGLSAPVSLLIGGSLVGVKWTLFVVGFTVLAAGSWKLRPSAAWRDESSRLEQENTRGQGNFQGLVDQLPPLRGRRLPDADRISDGTKLVLGGCLMLAASFLMEAALGIPR